MPPSAISGTPVSRAACAQASTAESCGTPTPATSLVVQAKPGPMPTLIASAPAAARSRTPSAVATLPAITSACGTPLQLAHRLQRRLRVAVGDVEHERVGVGGEQRLGALQVAAAHADRRRHAQAPLAVTGGVRIARSCSRSRSVTMPATCPSASASGSFSMRCRCSSARASAALIPGGPVTRRSRGVMCPPRRRLVAGAHVPRGEDPRRAALAVDDEQARYAPAPRFGPRLVEARAGQDSVRVRDHGPRQRLTRADLGDLGLDRQEAVEDPEPPSRAMAIAIGPRDGVHVGRDDGGLEASRAGQLRARVTSARERRPRAAGRAARRRT